MSTSESTSEARLASSDGMSLARIATVAEPTSRPPCVAVTVAVSADSSSTSSTAVSVASTDPAPAASVGVSGAST